MGSFTAHRNVRAISAGPEPAEVLFLILRFHARRDSLEGRRAITMAFKDRTPNATAECQRSPRAVWVGRAFVQNTGMENATAFFVVTLNLRDLRKNTLILHPSREGSN